MTTPETATSGHVTRRQVLDALADLNPSGFPDQPLWCCSGCSWAQARRASVAADTIAFFHDQDDEASFQGTEYRYLDADGQLIESIEETDEDAFFVQSVYHDDDLLIEPLYLHWQGDPTIIEAVFSRHGLRYVAPDSADVCFQIVPHTQP